jgi:hypothetical protein
MQQQSSRMEMDSMRDELEGARAVAGELERRNASLMRMTQQSLGREGDLKQAVNSTKAQVGSAACRCAQRFCSCGHGFGREGACTAGASPTLAQPSVQPLPRPPRHPFGA